MINEVFEKKGNSLWFRNNQDPNWILRQRIYPLFFISGILFVFTIGWFRKLYNANRLSTLNIFGYWLTAILILGGLFYALLFFYLIYKKKENLNYMWRETLIYPDRIEIQSDINKEIHMIPKQRINFIEISTHLEDWDSDSETGSTLNMRIWDKQNHQTLSLRLLNEKVRSNVEDVSNTLRTFLKTNNYPLEKPEDFRVWTGSIKYIGYSVSIILGIILAFL